MFDPIGNQGGLSLKVLSSSSGAIHHRRWLRLRSDFLPLEQCESIWRYSRPLLPSEPRQGWKVHISATILSACDVLECVGTYLKEKNIAFKAPATLDELARLNSGLWHGYSQIGKFITAYPADESAFCRTVNDLYTLLPVIIPAPSVPFDIRFRRSNIYYRYGSFIASGACPPKIRTPSGDLVSDDRLVPRPDWVQSPIAEDLSGSQRNKSLLETRYRAYRSIAQRGKGGVYEAIDFGAKSSQKCILKEGRRHGETSFDARDGRWRLENERNVLKSLEKRDINVPRVLDEFVVGNEFYLVLEKMDGIDLLRMVSRRKRRLALLHTLSLCKQIANLVAEIHAAGWIWRDCKPGNLFLTPEKVVRPIDFEGAVRIGSDDAVAWSTPHYAAPEVGDQASTSSGSASSAEDLFAMGKCFFFLLVGRLPADGNSRLSTVPKKSAFDKQRSRSTRYNCPFNDHPTYSVNSALDGVGRRRRNTTSNKDLASTVQFGRREVPKAVKAIILRLLSVEPERRPDAVEVGRVLALAEAHLFQKRLKPRVITDGVE